MEQGSSPQENELFCGFSHDIPRLWGCGLSLRPDLTCAPQNCSNSGAVVKADDNVEKTEDEEKGKCLPEKSFGKEINLISLLIIILLI